jgi:outer membrane lipoprotein-sorting protein
MKKLLILSACFFLASGALAQETEPAKEEAPAVPSVDQILKDAEEAIAKIKDYTGVMIKHERFEDGVEKAVMEFKFQRPFKVYIKYREPHTGREAIYKPGWNDGEAKVHKGSFPDVTMNLDPYGSWAMDGNHHPVTHFGLENTIKISANNLRKALKRKEGDFKVTEDKLWGQPIWKIEASFPKGGHFTTAKEDETLWDISKRTGQDMFIIMWANKDFDDPDDPDEGDRVFIPRYYGGRAEFCVSKKTKLPIKASTWDWAGRLYESYEYPEMKFDVGLTAKDFDPDNPKYDF